MLSWDTSSELSIVEPINICYTIIRVVSCFLVNSHMTVFLNFANLDTRNNLMKVFLMFCITSIQTLVHFSLDMEIYSVAPTGQLAHL